ncbi:P43 5S RNA-binding protein-like isoform X2 [Chiloscyllium plagiosum]|uniref:P43 5S RNA-binding protein-like isoform X2 n=1 Tax=Chiloscyllium plagiosum TaxID=36176 RepID=UPI001CB848A3|nr:P43 5S RNA-binding protein-like isoform X2 [Chiloscyllium plagiosum]
MLLLFKETACICALSLFLIIGLFTQFNYRSQVTYPKERQIHVSEKKAGDRGCDKCAYSQVANFWDKNVTECARLYKEIASSPAKRSELKQCCNCTYNFVVTQKNTPLGTELTYEVEPKRKIKITPQIFALFPKNMSFSNLQHKRCAVVGNGGNLVNSSCGAEIDRADFVFRCNLPPVGGKFTQDVGIKTNLVTANPSIITNRLRRMEVAGELLKQIPCDYPGCLATFTRRWKLEEHLSVHTGQKPYKCDQGECQKTFTRKSHLQRHVCQHLGQKKFRCIADGCTEAFVNNNRLKKHMIYQHGNKEYFKCSSEACGKTFKKNRDLKTHCYEHVKEPAFECQKEGCKMKFKTPNERKVHERKHNGYPCGFEECQLVATTWTQLQKHRKIHPSSVEHCCANCEKKFKHIRALRRHKLIHRAQNSGWTCPMDNCDLNFRTGFNLEHHIRKDHFKLLEYKCYFPDCQKAFAMKESLNRHLVVHDPDRKKLNINHECRQKWHPGQRNLVIEEKLTRLFNEKQIFRTKSKIECDLSGLFNERKITHPVNTEAYLSQLFENQLLLPGK